MLSESPRRKVEVVTQPSAEVATPQEFAAVNKFVGHAGEIDEKRGKEEQEKV